MTRPTCPQCQKQFGQRATELEFVVVNTGDELPAYKGNRRMVKTRTWNSGSGSGSYFGTTYGPNQTVIERTLWDGSHRLPGSAPFCTMRCALAFAREAHRDREIDKEGFEQ